MLQNVFASVELFFPRIEISLGVIASHITVTAIHLFRNIYYKTLKLSHFKKKEKSKKRRKRTFNSFKSKIFKGNEVRLVKSAFHFTFLHTWSNIIHTV